jgi:hypothetical protein
MSVVLFPKVCLYNKVTDETILYGQHKGRFRSVAIKNQEYRVIFTEEHHLDFYIAIKGKPSLLEQCIFEYPHISVTMADIPLVFPFEECDLTLNSTSAIITTIVKDYSHRLDEWIQYNLKLGFSGIVIFNNDANNSNGINEPTENCIRKKSTEEVCRAYKGKVWCVDFPYAPFRGNHWNSVQAITLYIGVNAFRTRCRNIALIDADEFIYLPKSPSMNIEDFFKNYGTITMNSNILTNKSNTDLLDNNILQLAKYVGEDKYPKTILHTASIGENEFIYTPHQHPSERVLPKTDIIHYHCWMNNRCHYHESMPRIDFLKL